MPYQAIPTFLATVGLLFLGACGEFSFVKTSKENSAKSDQAGMDADNICAGQERRTASEATSNTVDEKHAANFLDGSCTCNSSDDCITDDHSGQSEAPVTEDIVIEDSDKNHSDSVKNSNPNQNDDEPENAEIDDDPKNCSGIAFDGHCYYLAENNTSCSETCEAYGGYDEATNTEIGAFGSRFKCKSIIQELTGVDATLRGFSSDAAGNPIGCAYYQPNSNFQYFMWVTTFESQNNSVYNEMLPTTEGSSYNFISGTSSVRRACACKE